MIAKYNIKVNGRWYNAGEELPEEPKKAEKPKASEEPKPVPLMEGTAPVAETPVTEDPKVEEKPRSTSRRKVSK